MSYVQRPFTSSYTIASPVSAGLKYYNPLGVVDYNQPYTMMGWYRGGPTPYDYGSGQIMEIAHWYSEDDTTDGSHDGVQTWAKEAVVVSVAASTESSYWATGDWTNLVFDYNDSSKPSYPLDYADPLFATPYGFGIFQWVHVALVRENATTMEIYINGTLNYRNTSIPSISSRSLSSSAIILGGRHARTSGEWTAGSRLDLSPDCKLACVRVYSRQLTQSEIAVEMGYSRALNQTGLYADWPLLTDLLDVSGNGRHLSHASPPDSRIPVQKQNEVYAWDGDVPNVVSPSVATTLTVEMEEGDSSAQYPGRGWRETSSYLERWDITDDKFAYMRAKVYDQYSVLMDPQPAVQWTVTNPLLIQVDRESLSLGYSTVKAVALGIGTTTVTASVGDVTANISIQTTPVPYYFLLTETTASISAPFNLHIPLDGTRTFTAGWATADGLPYTQSTYKGATKSYEWDTYPPSFGVQYVGANNVATVTIRGDAIGTYPLSCLSPFGQYDTRFGHVIIVDPTPTTTTKGPVVHSGLKKLTIPEIQWDNRQPDEINFLRPVAFRFHIKNLPKVSYFVQSANIPVINLGTAVQTSPFIDLPHPGDKVTHGELTIKFLVQEDMANYIELYNWLIGLGFPDNRGQFKNYVEARGFDFRRPVRSEMPQLSDATLTILTSNNIPIAHITFMECFPTSLSSLDFDVSAGSSQYFQSIATFQYNMFVPETEAV